jgi:hypothetical protein
MMTESQVIEAVEDLYTQSPQRIWGLSPESIYSAVVAKSEHEPILERLSHHIQAETLRTNDTRNQELVATIHEWLLSELSLFDNGELTLLGAFVLSSEMPTELLRTITVSQVQSVETVLRSYLDIEEVHPRSEFESLLANEWDQTVLGPLLGSLGFLKIYPDSVEPVHEKIQSALTEQTGLSNETAEVAAFERLLPAITNIRDEQCLKELSKKIVGATPNRDSSEQTIAATLAVKSGKLLDPEAIATAIDAQRQQYESDFDKFRSLLTTSSDCEIDWIETEDPVDSERIANGQPTEKSDLLANIIATVANHHEFVTFDPGFITDRLPMTQYAVYQSFSSISCIECEFADNDLIKFNSLPTSVKGEDISDEYTTHLVNRCSSTRGRVDSLSDVSLSATPTPRAADQVIIQEYESVEKGEIAPTYFTYTLFDPDALGEKKTADYIGDSRGLGMEIARLRRWHRNRSNGMRTYTEMTDQLFSMGLERDLSNKILRIMTPFDDDTFNEYVAQIRRLLKKGFEVRLLTRHTKEPWEWRRLQQNLLSEIKDHRDQVTMRTYSRFKKYQRVTPDQNYRDIGEFGIHGKVQTIGQSSEGAALLGSANFMRNSYDWNPECGVYTERNQFVNAAIEFFDIVWDISEADELSTDRLQEIPDRQLVPSFYN